MRKDALVRGLSEIFPYTFRGTSTRQKNGTPLEVQRALRCESIADKYHVALLGCFTEDDSMYLDEVFCDRVRCATSLFFYHECIRLQHNIHAALRHALSCQKTCFSRMEEYTQLVQLYEQMICDLRCVYERIMNEIEDILAEEVLPVPQTPVFQDVVPDAAIAPSFSSWTSTWNQPDYVI